VGKFEALKVLKVLNEFNEFKEFKGVTLFIDNV